jgi:hypothetical protein
MVASVGPPQANITATLGSFYWLGFETSGLSPDKKRLAWLGATSEWWHRRDQAPIQIGTLSPVASHDLLASLDLVHEVFPNENSDSKAMVVR